MHQKLSLNAGTNSETLTYIKPLRRGTQAVDPLEGVNTYADAVPSR